MTEQKPITKKIINSPDTCVDDNLRGVVALYPKLQLHPKHRVVTLRRQDDSGRVAVIGGGGSGHEPFAAGLVGPGVLDGAVAGGVFASPPTGHVLYGITQLNKYNSGGVLVILGNYTGDRLNFGKAIEKAKIAGIKVEGVIVGEDVASSHNKTGGRGMIAEVFLYKLCGAMSAKGYDLISMRDVASLASKHMGTLGVCLTACSLPGQPPLFEIAYDEMELGAGVHGEAGIQKLKMTTAKETVALILDKIVSHLQMRPGARVAAMINNLGGTSLMETNIIAAEIKDYFENKKIKLERLYSGHLKTSLEMHGFQICLFHLTKEHGDLWLELLDAPAGAPGWPGGDISRGGDGRHEDDEALQTHQTKSFIKVSNNVLKPSELYNIGDARRVAENDDWVLAGPTLTAKEQKILQKSLQKAAEELVKNEVLLNKLDSGCGDGDCGITLKNFAIAVLSYLKTASLERPSNVLWELSEMAETDMGGTSGGIYSLGLAAASQAFARASSNERVAWLSAWDSAMDAITKYGGAEPGDRTMLDTLHTAAKVFRSNLTGDLKSCLRKTADAAESGCKVTASMVARAGRASYVSSEHLNNEDAGARAVAVWLLAVLHTMCDLY